MLDTVHPVHVLASAPRSRQGGGPCWWSCRSWSSGTKPFWPWCRTAGRLPRFPHASACRDKACTRGIARYERGGLAALADRSHRPSACPHQITPETEAVICELRREHPGWGPRRIRHELARCGVDPVPGRSSIYRCLKRHALIELRCRRKRRDEFRRFERDRPMQLWQMDVMGGVELDDGTELKVVTGVDDHSRFCVAAGLVTRATSKAVCEVFAGALHRYGIPDEILTDNAKVFTGRVGPPPV